MAAVRGAGHGRRTFARGRCGARHVLESVENFPTSRFTLVGRAARGRGFSHTTGHAGRHGAPSGQTG
eukprot:3148399-Prymnesium_polylepis.1